MRNTVHIEKSYIGRDMIWKRVYKW